MLKKIVSARCFPDLKCLFIEDYDYCASGMIFYPLGRDALLSGLISLGLRKGDSIIVPAFMCKSTIQPLQAFGFSLIFVDIGKDFELSIEVIKKILFNCETIKALIVVHYFGFTKDIHELVDICHESGVKVVEDASHSFMSQSLRNKNFFKGDIEIFSLRKSLPIADGGALIINNSEHKALDPCENNTLYSARNIRYLCLRLLEKLIISLRINIYGKTINDFKNKLRGYLSPEKKYVDFKPGQACQPSGQLVKYLSNDRYLKDLQRKISHNFNELSQGLQFLGFNLCTNALEDQIVPQACVVYDNKGKLVDYLRSHGVGAWQWPGEEIPDEVAMNYSLYPNSHYFDKTLVLIPVHQTLSSNEIDYMIKVLSRWKM